MFGLPQWIVYGANTIIFLWLFWALYVLVMGLYRAHLMKNLTKLTYVLGAPWLILGLAFDFIANIFIATIIFLDLPREYLVTARLKRYIKDDPEEWRGKFSNWICNNLLDVFDPSGNHC